VPANAPGRIAIVRRGRPPAAGRPVALLAQPDEDDVALSRLPGALQERIRQRLWGEDRERAREAMERAELGVSAEREDASPRADRLADASDPEERWAVARRPPAGTKPRAGEGAAAAANEAPGGNQVAARGDGAREAERDGGAGAAAGAGTGTDPHLLGEASAERAARARFDLPLAARVRALGGGPAPLSGEAPPPAPDARPDLAAAQRRDAPVPKMGVPPAYEAAVRALFAHRQGEEAP